MAWFASVGQGVACDVGDVIVGQVIEGLFAATGSGNQPVAPEHSQVLRREGLRDIQRVHQLMDAPGTSRQLEDDCQPVGRAQRPQQLAGIVKARRLKPGTQWFGRTHDHTHHHFGSNQVPKRKQITSEQISDCS